MFGVDRQEIVVGDKVILNDWKGCNPHCNCAIKGNKHLKYNVVYFVSAVEEFGGGCPPTYLVLQDVKPSKGWFKGYPKQWFTKIQEVRKFEITPS